MAAPCSERRLLALTRASVMRAQIFEVRSTSPSPERPTSHHPKCLELIPETRCVFVSPNTRYILPDPLNYVQKLIFESSEAVSVVSTFDDLGLKEDLLRGIYAYSECLYYLCSLPSC